MWVEDDDALRHYTAAVNAFVSTPQSDGTRLVRKT
jgi:hypothetical protein